MTRQIGRLDIGTGSSASRLLIANNRGPVSFTLGENGLLSAKRGGGGVVTGLSSVAARRDVLWVCIALSDADRAAVQGSSGGRFGLDGSPGGSTVQMLDIPAATFHRAHNGVANSTLWFVHHMLYDTPNRPQFGPEFQREWDSFRAYNHAFAQALAAGADWPVHATASADRSAVRVLVQDYHLTLVPRMLADMGLDARIAHFTHTPWAPPDYFRILPRSVGREILEGLLGADHAGFHCQRWADAFLDCCEMILGAQVDRGRQQVTHHGHVTGIGVHPLGVDSSELISRSREPDVDARVAALAEVTSGRKVIVRIDRTELSKNIVRGLAAYRQLLVAHPEWHGKVIHLDIPRQH